MPQFLWIAASGILLFLGAMHLYYTFFTNKFSIRNQAVEEGMKQSYTWLTKRTTVWNAWIGFNASHSLAGIYIGLINIILAIQFYEELSQSIALKGLTLLSGLFLLFLGKRYWFNIPFLGILVATCFYVLALVLMEIG